MVRRKLIRNLVTKLIEDHQVTSAPVDVRRLAKSHGVEVQLESTDEDLSGFLYRDRKKDIAIIGVNADHHPNRRNFTAAHELGHFLLHDFSDVHVDRQFKVWLRNEASSQGTDTEEKEANLFAAELLMPVKLLKKSIASIDEIELDEEVIDDLAKEYGVSKQAMMFRLVYLGYLEQ